MTPVHASECPFMVVCLCTLHGCVRERVRGECWKYYVNMCKSVYGINAMWYRLLHAEEMILALCKLEQKALGRVCACVRERGRGRKRGKKPALLDV